MVNSGELGSRSDGATPISNRRALSDDVTNFSSIDYNHGSLKVVCGQPLLARKTVSQRSNI
nr:palindromic element RPE2 domain-containing protein [Rickettsia endosymbiont of Oedothorax gibbosus]